MTQGVVGANKRDDVYQRCWSVGSMGSLATVQRATRQLGLLHTFPFFSFLFPQQNPI